MGTLHRGHSVKSPFLIYRTHEQFVEGVRGLRWQSHQLRAREQPDLWEGVFHAWGCLDNMQLQVDLLCFVSNQISTSCILLYLKQP